MPDFFTHADALLVTLKSDTVFAQTIPSKLQSYMACGRPVLAALDGEGARVVDDAGAGLAVAAGDDQRLAEVALELYQMSSEQRLVMGARGRDYYDRHFERDMLVGKLEQWMRELTKEGLCES